MSDQPRDPNRPDDLSIGGQPKDVEEIRYSAGPGETELGGPPVVEGHPKGLWVLFITEMWERFSYYGMRALLVLYLIASTNETLPDGAANTNPGFGWTEDRAYNLYALYTWAVYLTPIAGGWLADKFLGTHRSMLIGGWIIALGHITLAATELFGVSAGDVVGMNASAGAYLTFMAGLVLIIIGTGFFKPCVSVMVGQLYAPGDRRRDSGFTIFYMGINLGAFLSPLIAGTLGETVGWHWGFGSAAVGMLAGLFFYQIFRPKYLKGIGDAPRRGEQDTTGMSDVDRGKYESDHYELTRPLTSIDFQRLAVILILAFVGNIIFWMAFEQAGSSMNVFAAQETDRTLVLPQWIRDFLGTESVGTTAIAYIIGFVLFIPLVLRLKKITSTGFFTSVIAWGSGGVGLLMVILGVAKTVGLLTSGNPTAGLANMQEFPATWYQSVNALTIVICAPFFGALWVWLSKKNLNPSSPMKFALGLYLLGLSFIAMVIGSMQSRDGGLAGPHWLAITYIVYTWGELCFSPVGLSLVTKLAPIRLQSLMMGIWFFTLSLGNLAAGQFARVSEKVRDGEWTFILDGLPGFYLLLVVLPITVGVLIMFLTPVLKRMSHGADIT
jgi:POT family proton-dependent oligopeptide transporter